MITNEHLVEIEKAFDATVLEEIFDQYRRSGGVPSEKVCEALARVYGKTAQDLEAQYRAFIAAPP